jgi:D-alanine-D-alanine ligase
VSKRFARVGVLMGGPSAEREVSLKSGAAVARGLREAGYAVVEIVLPGSEVAIPNDVEAVFIALHGTFGEDGTLQALLAEQGVPYTGSHAEASRTAFDKVATKHVLEQEGIPTPRYQVLRNGDPRALDLPVVVKPALQGSSIGLHCVMEERQWAPAVADACSYDGDVLVEAYIEGAELTVGVVGDAVLPVVEIRAPGGHYDYEAKYLSGTTEYLVPAPISEEQAEACSTWAAAAFQALGCHGLGRVDFRMAPDGELYVLEVNTIPGFTETSLLPKAAQAAGISFSNLCGRIMETAGTPEQTEA